MRKYYRVPDEETPEKTVENIPEKLVKQALDNLKYIECKNCENRFWVKTMSGHNVHVKCDSCEETFIL